MYAMICTKPNIVQVVGMISCFIRDLHKEHWNVVKRLFRYIKGTLNATLCFGELEYIITRYVDSNFTCGLDKRKSIIGYVFTLAREAMSCLSKLQTVVVLCTTKVEYMKAT